MIMKFFMCVAFESMNTISLNHGLVRNSPWSKWLRQTHPSGAGICVEEANF